MRYEFAEDIQKKSEEISKILFPHIQLERIKCFRSYGTYSKRTIARCHTISKIMQKALQIKPFYALEFISERFDKLNEEEKTKIIIHELMHIPLCFGGGFKHHNYVTEKNINVFYKQYLNEKNKY